MIAEAMRCLSCLERLLTKLSLDLQSVFSLFALLQEDGRQR